MERPSNLKVGDKFVVTVEDMFSKGSVVELVWDDTSDCPAFKAISGSQLYWSNRSWDEEVFEGFENLAPYIENQDTSPEKQEDIVKKPNHYMFFEETGIEVKHINEELLNKIEASDMEMTLCEAGWLQQALQYLLRCSNKNQWQDIEKAVEALEIMLRSHRGGKI